MKRPSPAQRPPPRTLAAAPPVALRVPQPLVTAGASIPTLASLLTAGIVAPGCAEPVCGATRADELEAHGALGFRAARGGAFATALREIGIALGVVGHGAVTRVPDVMAAGAVPVVQPRPLPGPETSLPEPVINGAAVPVSPTPPTPPLPTSPRRPHPPPHVVPPPPGGIRPVTPAPGSPDAPPSPPQPVSPRAGAIRAVTPAPDSPESPRPRHHPSLPVPGGRGAVGPLPPTHATHRTG